MPRRHQGRPRSAHPRLVALLAAAALLAGCAGLPAGAAATVDGVAVPRDLLEQEVRARTAEVTAVESLPPEQREAVVGTAQREVLGWLIEGQTVTNLGVELGAEVTDADVDEWLTEFTAQAGGEEGYLGFLAMQGWSRSLFEEVIVPAQVAIQALEVELLADPPAVELRAVRHILLETEPEAAAVVAELAAGADFAALAAARSIDTGSGAQGGALGFAPRNAFVAEFSDAAWEAELGETVGPVRSDFGFHVLEVTDIEVIEPEELSAAEVQQLVGQELDRLISEAFDRAEVRIAPGLGSWDVATRRVVGSVPVGASTPAQPGLGGLGTG